METLDKLIESVATDLAHHDEVTLPDGRVIRFMEEPDYDTRIEDFVDCYGKVSYIWKWDYQPQRPEGFDGRARIIHTIHERYWWQPPADLADEHLKHTGFLVSEILEWGFYIYTLEVVEACEKCAQFEVTDRCAIGGMEPTTDMDSRIEVIRDLLSNIIQ